MRKLFILTAIAALFYGCSVEITGSHTMCHTKKIHYVDMFDHPIEGCGEPQWGTVGCKHYVGNDCAEFDYNYFCEIEECEEIYIKD